MAHQTAQVMLLNAAQAPCMAAFSTGVQHLHQHEWQRVGCIFSVCLHSSINIVNAFPHHNSRGLQWAACFTLVLQAVNMQTVFGSLYDLFFQTLLRGCCGTSTDDRAMTRALGEQWCASEAEMACTGAATTVHALHAASYALYVDPTCDYTVNLFFHCHTHTRRASSSRLK